MTIIDDSKPQFHKVTEHLATELSSIRTGRATPALVENLQVEVYGVMQPVKALASISTLDARTLQIEPWDASVVRAIDSAIQKSEIGINPTVDGKVIRLKMPEMTDETRQKMVRLMKDKLEDAKISVRAVREDVKKSIERMEGIGKDEQHKLLENLDKLTRDMNSEIEEIGKKKEAEIMTV